MVWFGLVAERALGKCFCGELSVSSGRAGCGLAGSELSGQGRKEIIFTTSRSLGSPWLES